MSSLKRHLKNHVQIRALFSGPYLARHLHYICIRKRHYKEERYIHFTDLRWYLNVVCFCFRFGRISLTRQTRCVRPPWARRPSPWTVSGAGTRSGPAPGSSATSRTTCRKRASAVPIQGTLFLQPMVQTNLLLESMFSGKGEILRDRKLA